MINNDFKPLVKEDDKDSILDDSQYSSKWAERFILSAIIQGIIALMLTASGIAIQFLYSSKVNIIQFLSLSFEGAAKWAFIGFIFYIILIISMAMVATFYNYIEMYMQKRIHGTKSVLTWFNLVATNVGGAGLALTMIYGGLAGTGMLEVIITGDANSLTENPSIMAEFIVPISLFAAFLIAGALVGSFVFLSIYFDSKPNKRID